MTDRFDWRAHLPVHPACAALPAIPHDELIDLGNDIKTNFLRLPIVVHARGDASNPEFELVDGRSRLDAMVAVGIKFKFERVHCEEHNQTSLHLIHDPPIGAGAAVYTFRGLSEDEIKGLVLSLNAFRRMLDAKGRRAVIDTLLKLDPGKSDRQIAEQTRSSPTTVGKRRKKAEIAGDVSKMDTRVDTKGRKQPAKKAKPGTTAEAMEKDRAEVVALNDTVLRAEKEARGDKTPEGATKAAIATAPVNPKDITLESFDAHVLELIRITKGQKPQRFAKTSIPLPVLGGLAHFIRELVAVRKLAAEPAADNAETSAQKRKAEYATSETADLSIPGFLRRGAETLP